jgi:hypothetical protein
MISLEDINPIEHNERDIEVPSLISLVQEYKPKTFLDVGAHYSWFTYAPAIKLLVEQYDALDLIEDPKTAEVVDKYMITNVTDFVSSIKYDFVSCISVIEHSGISTYKSEEYKIERIKVFEKLMQLTKKYLFLSFPYGAIGMVENQYANITKEDLSEFMLIAIKYGFSFEPYFYYNEFPQGGEAWAIISSKEASKVSLDQTKGVQCVCLLLCKHYEGEYI